MLPRDETHEPVVEQRLDLERAGVGTFTSATSARPASIASTPVWFHSRVASRTFGALAVRRFQQAWHDGHPGVFRNRHAEEIAAQRRLPAVASNGSLEARQEIVQHGQQAIGTGGPHIGATGPHQQFAAKEVASSRERSAHRRLAEPAACAARVMCRSSSSA
jgi:hypothetical protein